jgi:hypothetical protein
VGYGTFHIKAQWDHVPQVLSHCSPHDEHKSSGPRPVKLCSDQ